MLRTQIFLLNLIDTYFQAVTFLTPILAFVATAIMIVVLRPLAISIGLVDIPSGRKSHSGNIPLIGGMAIFIGALVSLIVQYGFVTNELLFSSSLPAFFCAALVLLIVGAWDDYQELPALTRIVAQIIASFVMIYVGGVVLVDLGRLDPNGATLYLGVLSVPFTVFATLGIINAMNMCDGLDGLSGSLALIGLLGFGIANALWGAPEYQPLIIVFSACVISFLMFNLRTLWRPNAWVFLGDAGSMLLGITLCWVAIALTQGDERVVSPAAALWFLMVPIYDAVSMMVRRLLRGRSPFEADREHLHHIFLLAGFSVGETVTLMTGFAIGGVVVGLGGTYMGIADIYLALLFLAGGMFYYGVIRRAWRVMRFLRRSICRRAELEVMVADRRKFDDPSYVGAERRSGAERRGESEL
jgi:UDP-GlcNAc:undecaprenyl-phosphate GlcNAc-1-phosphate transferase